MLEAPPSGTPRTSPPGQAQHDHRVGPGKPNIESASVVAVCNPALAREEFNLDVHPLFSGSRDPVRPPKNADPDARRGSPFEIPARQRRLTFRLHPVRRLPLAAFPKSGRAWVPQYAGLGRCVVTRATAGLPSPREPDARARRPMPRLHRPDLTGAGGWSTADRCKPRTAARRRHGLGAGSRRKGDRWWRVWACPDHLEGLTGLREFGRRRPD